MTVLQFDRVGARLMRVGVRGFKVTATVRYFQMMSAYRSDWLGSKGISHGATHSRAELVLPTTPLAISLFRYAAESDRVPRNCARVSLGWSDSEG